MKKYPEKLPERTARPYENKSGPALLLVALLLATLAFIGGVFLAWRLRLPHPLWAAFNLSASAYAIGLLVLLIMEPQKAAVAPNIVRVWRSAVALLGLVLSFLLIFEFISVGSWQNLTESLFIAAPSIGVLFSSISDRMRALIFVVMAVARLDQPWVYAFPPFIFMSILCGVAAIYCLTRSQLRSDLIRARAVAQILFGFAATGLCAYGLLVAYRKLSPIGMLLFSVAFLFFGGLTGLRLLLGDYWWRKVKQY